MENLTARAVLDKVPGDISDVVALKRDVSESSVGGARMHGTLTTFYLVSIHRRRPIDTRLM